MKKVNENTNTSNWLKKTTLLLVAFLPLFATAQTGPAGVGTTDGSSALKMWLDAGTGTFADTFQIKTSKAGDKVKFWKDLSGSNNNVYAEADSNSPWLASTNPDLNNQNAIRFYQYKDSLNRRNYLLSKSFSKTNDITIYCVFNAITRAGGNNVTPYQANKYDPNMWYSGSGLVDGGNAGLVNDVSLAFSDTSVAAGVGDSTNSTDYCIKTPASLNKTYFAVLQKEAWTGKLSIALNNSAETSYQAGAQPINNSIKYFVGSNSDAYSGKTSPFFNGYIANVLVYNKILNSAEKIILENYLSAKYGTPLFQNDLYKWDEPISGNYDFELIGIGKAADGSSQSRAKGEGVIEINSNEMKNGDFVIVGHNGVPLTASSDGLPEGVKFKLDRKWIVGKTGQAQKIDIIVDPKEISLLDNQDVALLIDTDNNGSFVNETVGKGIIPTAELSNSGRLVFRGVELKHGSTFTFGKLKPACTTDCENYFSPNGDGVSDSYYIDNNGKTAIYDRFGGLVKSMQTPAFWDGTNEKGQLSVPGIYFLIANEDSQKTVTLIR
ncbi:MAG: T9SS type B sorting domain-containing protein [Opitutaceae bacterium]|nr:T9SS type B sorting domain-containing protein [Cytophagales bacterium]